MDEENYERIEVDASGWFAICDMEDEVEVIFANENYAVWYLKNYGWSSYKIKRIAAKNESLFSSEQEHRRTEDDEH